MRVDPRGGVVYPRRVSRPIEPTPAEVLRPKTTPVHAANPGVDRLIRSIQQSMRAEGHPVTSELVRDALAKLGLA